MSVSVARAHLRHRSTLAPPVFSCARPFRQRSTKRPSVSKKRPHSRRTRPAAVARRALRYGPPHRAQSARALRPLVCRVRKIPPSLARSSRRGVAPSHVQAHNSERISRQTIRTQPQCPTHSGPGDSRQELSRPGPEYYGVGAGHCLLRRLYYGTMAYTRKWVHEQTEGEPVRPHSFSEINVIDNSEKAS